MIASTAFYAGLLVTLLGVVSVVYPLRRLRVRTRRAGAGLAALGATLVAVPLLLPGRVLRTPGPGAGESASALDELMPAYDFNEFHAIHVQAPPAKVYSALKEVRPGEIRLFLLLTGIRSLNPARLLGHGVPPLESQRPILEVTQRGSFVLMNEEPAREIVLGTCSQFWRLRGNARCPGVHSPPELLAFRGPGYAKATINFQITPEGDGSRLTTQTRILATDSGARRRFAAYWRLIYPGSSLIRIGWLEAIKRRAESQGSGARS